MKDRQPLLVYLPAKVRDQIQRQADLEGTSASAIGRKVLMREFPGDGVPPPRRRSRRDRPPRPSRS